MNPERVAVAVINYKIFACLICIKFNMHRVLIGNLERKGQF